MTKFLQLLIKAYAFLISPLLGQNCRFYPTCSCYAHQALEKHGAVKGVFLTLLRILKCHPWHKGEYVDEVPQEFRWGFQWLIDRVPFIGYKHRKSQ